MNELILILVAVFTGLCVALAWLWLDGRRKPRRQREGTMNYRPGDTGAWGPAKEGSRHLR